MTFFDTAYLQSLKASYPITHISERLGLPRTAGRSYCPRCQTNGGKTPDLASYEEHVHCFKCAWHSDIFGLVQEVLGKSFLDAVLWISGNDALLQKSPSMETSRAVPPAASSPSRNYAQIFAVAQAFAHRHETEVDAYLRSRGFTFEAIKQQIGYLPQDRWIGRTAESGRLVFPHFDYADHRRLINLYGRALDEDSDARHDHGKGPSGFWSANPWRARNCSHLVLTEGTFDALSLQAMGCTLPIVAAFGIHGFRFEKFPLLKKLTLALDQDTAGRKKAGQLEALAAERGLIVGRIPEEAYAGEKDLNDAWKSQLLSA